MSVQLRRLRAGEVAQLRELRLRALSEAPDAFATTVDEARARPPEYWAEWTRDSVAAETQVTVVAVDGERWVGLVVGWLLEASPATAWLARLWVDPSVRRAGLASRLIDALADWARERGATTLELSVTTNNDGAKALYDRAGFRETGRRRPLPADPSRTEVFLGRPVRP